MAKSLTSEIIKLKDVRGSFLRLHKPKAFQEGQEPRYEGTFLLDPSNPAHAGMIAKIKEEASKLIKAKWGEKPAGLKLCFGLADNDEMKKKYDGYAGMFYVVTANTTKPTVCNRQREEVVEGGKEDPYSGCFVNTNVTLWTQDNKFGKALRGNLRIVQFNRPGTAFSGAGSADPDAELETLEELPSTGGTATVGKDDFDLD